MKRKYDDTLSPTSYSELDEDGDLELRVHEADSDETKTFKVNKGTLCLASPVFRAMLGRKSKFREAVSDAQQERPEITLKEDDAMAMEIVLRVLHMKGAHVPNAISFPLLVAITSLCDKYALSKSMGYWPRVWAGVHYRSWYSHETEDWLLICSVFNFTQAMQKVAKNVILNSTMKSEQLILSCDETLRDKVPALTLSECPCPCLKASVTDFLPGKLINKRNEKFLEVEAFIWHRVCKLRTSYDLCMAHSQIWSDSGRTQANSCCQLQLGRILRAFPDLVEPSNNSTLGSNFTLEDIRETCVDLIDGAGYAPIEGLLGSLHVDCNGEGALLEPVTNIIEALDCSDLLPAESPETTFPDGLQAAMKEL